MGGGRGGGDVERERRRGGRRAGLGDLEVTEASPAAVGVPEIVPVVPLSKSPGGSGLPVTDQAYGALPFAAVRVVE